MKSYFDAEVQAELRGRLQALQPGSPALWGRMNAPQMLAHCVEGMGMPTGDVRCRWSFPSLFGWMFKKIAYSDTPFRHNVPTAPELMVADPREFQKEKARLLEAFGRLAAGPGAIRNHRHPFFGNLTDAQWGVLLFKHLDHHFRQFGV